MLVFTAKICNNDSKIHFNVKNISKGFISCRDVCMRMNIQSLTGH